MGKVGEAGPKHVGCQGEFRGASPDARKTLDDSLRRTGKAYNDMLVRHRKWCENGELKK